MDLKTFKKILNSYMGLESYSEKLLPKFHSTNSEFVVILQNLNYHSGDKKSQMAVILEFA